MRAPTLIMRLAFACSLAIPATLRAATPDDTVSAREYEVYSQALAYLADSLHMTAPLLVEGHLRTVVPMIHWMGHDSMFYEGSGIVLDSGTVRQFLEAGTKPLVLRPRFADSLSLVLISTLEMHLAFGQGNGTETLYEVFPHARRQGLLGLHRAVFSADGTRALMYISSLIEFPRDWGEFMLLDHRNGRWQVVATKLIVDNTAP